MKSILYYINKYLVHQEHLRFSWLQFAAAAGGALLSGIMSKKASKAQAEAVRRQAEANRKIAYNNAAMIEDTASRNLKMSEHNINFSKLEREEEQFFLNREKMFAIQAKERVSEEVDAQIDELKKNNVREEAQLIAQMAASGMDISSVSATGITNDLAINTGLEIAWLRRNGMIEQMNLLNEIGLLSRNIERSQALSVYDEAVARDEAAFNYDMSQREAQNQRISGDAGVAVASSKAKAIKAEGTASMVSGFASAVDFGASAYKGFGSGKGLFGASQPGTSPWRLS